MNLATVCVLLVVAGLAALALHSIIKDKKQHKSCCGGSCSGCGMSSLCHDPHALVNAYHAGKTKS